MHWAQICGIAVSHVGELEYKSSFLRCFRDPIRDPRIESQVPRNQRKVSSGPRIREIGPLQVHTRNLTFSWHVLRKEDDRFGKYPLD